jgi:D-serine dehydratase
MPDSSPFQEATMPPLPEYIAALCESNPYVRALSLGTPVHWSNPRILPAARAIADSGFTASDARDAEARLERFAPYLAEVFPETRPAGGIIESPLRPIPRMKEALRSLWKQPIDGNVLLKMDSHLAVSGSIKARGGLYEVLCRAEKLALSAGLLRPGDSYGKLASKEARAFFAAYSLAVGSTGNLGLSVGLMGAALGFQTTVHMSSEARQWKKDLLRSRGVMVVEYSSDYGTAVASGRKIAAADPRCHFVDDENSRDLFLGYSVAGLRIGGQLDALGIRVTPERPLLVYLPCGVGGGPGGVAFGLKLALGDAVSCYFAEPIQAPAVSLGLISGLNDAISARDIGLGGKTAADGLAVSRPSALACKAMRNLLAGVFTVEDEVLFPLLHLLAKTEDIRIEPSAAAGFPGILLSEKRVFCPAPVPKEATHLVWATGGSLVPPREWAGYDEQGKKPLADVHR